MYTKDLPPRHPPFERPTYKLSSPAPPINPKEDWRMPLIQYRKAPKYPDHVPTYEQSMLALSRRIRNKSLPPLPNYRDHLLSYKPRFIQTTLDRQIPSRSTVVFDTRNYSRGLSVVGRSEYLGCGALRQRTPARGF